MTSPQSFDPARVEAIFTDALDVPPGRERSALLDRACAGDAELRRRVDDLLAAHERADAFLPPPNSVANTAVPPSAPESVGATIGRYKLLEQIGEGGFGVVFMAEQASPVRRHVALKVIKLGMDTRQVVARFEAERQALAMMDHPNVARVIDAGATDTGRPYFVMELVKGVPITEYCDAHKLSIDARLGLFEQVCQAVQHAHQKGIIHRDLKPTNVLVATRDDRPVAKVIDFGIAKATQARLTERTLFTEFRQWMGTPQYISPEQADGVLDVDTRSDVYSLGVLLYELLTGTTPFGPKELREKAYEEMRRVIREEEPPRPSTRLTATAELPSIAACRGLEPKKLSALVQGELDWMVMKALEKDRSRRYETANDFARDIERYLRDEAVEACPPSAIYRLRKFARRNKGPVLTAALVLLTLTAGIVGTTLGLVRVEHARKVERQATQDALDREAETNAVLNFVEEKVFAAAQPPGEGGGLGHDVTLRRAIETALPFVESNFTDRPLIEARLRSTLASSFQSLGEAKTASEQAEAARALYTKHRGPDHPDTLETMHLLANIYPVLGRDADALKLREETLALAKSKLGPDHLRTLSSMEHLATSYAADRPADALKLFEEAMAMRMAKYGADHAHTIRATGRLGTFYSNNGRHLEAIKLYERTLPLMKAHLPAGDHYTLFAMNSLAYNYTSVGRQAEALKLREEATAIYREKYGPKHPYTLYSMGALAADYNAAGRRAESSKLVDEALAGADGTSLGSSNCIPGLIALRIGQFQRAKDVAGCRATAELWERAKFTDPSSLYNAACYRAVTAAVLRATDASPDAARTAAADDERAMEHLTKAVARGFGDAALMMTDKDLAFLRGREDFLKLLPAVEANLERDISAAREAARQGHDNSKSAKLLLSLLNQNAWALATAAKPDLRNPAQALAFAEEAVALAPQDANVWNTVGVARYRAGDWNGAITALQQYRAMRRNDQEWSNPFVLAMAHWRLGNTDEARRWYDTGADWMDRKQPTNATLILFRKETVALLGVNEKQRRGSSTVPATTIPSAERRGITPPGIIHRPTTRP